MAKKKEPGRREREREKKKGTCNGYEEKIDRD